MTLSNHFSCLSILSVRIHSKRNISSSTFFQIFWNSGVEAVSSFSFNSLNFQKISFSDSKNLWKSCHHLVFHSHLILVSMYSFIHSWISDFSFHFIAENLDHSIGWLHISEKVGIIFLLSSMFERSCKTCSLICGFMI